MKKMIFSFLGVCFFSILAAAEEQHSVVVFEHLNSSKPYQIQMASLQMKAYQGRRLIAVEVFAVPQKVDLPNFSIQFVLPNGQTIKKSNLTYTPESYKDIRPVRFDLPTSTLEEIDGAKFLFDQDMAVSRLRFIFEQTPSCGFAGEGCEAQISQLGQLLEYHLYDEENLMTRDIFIRSVAAQELAQYSSTTSFDFLMKVAQYAGVHIDYDLRVIAYESLSKMVVTLCDQFGEERVADLFLEKMDEAQDILASMFLIDELAKFKTSAPLFFFIKIHTYSPTHKGNMGTDILEKIYLKPDFSEYLGKYKQRLLSEVFKMEGTEGDWAQERACQAFALAPQPGILATLIPTIQSASYSLEFYCLKAINSTLAQLDIANEILPFEDHFIHVVTEAPKPITQLFGSPYSWSSGYREVAAISLAKMKTQKSIAALHQAMLIPDQDDVMTDLIKKLLGE